jgi:quinol-cytochrome oxidoreductase complex cytochrome b subunit
LTALLRFYVWHIFGLTVAAVILVAWHAFRVRRDGGVAVPPPGLRLDKARISRDTLVRREMLAILVLGIVLILMASFLPAPIAPAMMEKPIVAEEARAPWFFLWIQQMLKWGNPLIFGVLIPFGILIILIFIPYVFPKPVESDIGQWFPKSNRLAQVTVSLIALTVIALTLLSLVS